MNFSDVRDILEVSNAEIAVQEIANGWELIAISTSTVVNPGATPPPAHPFHTVYILGKKESPPRPPSLAQGLRSTEDQPSGPGLGLFGTGLPGAPKSE